MLLLMMMMICIKKCVSRILMGDLVYLNAPGFYANDSIKLFGRIKVRFHVQ